MATPVLITDNSETIGVTLQLLSSGRELSVSTMTEGFLLEDKVAETMVSWFVFPKILVMAR
jgi:hypothetical protein